MISGQSVTKPTLEEVKGEENGVWQYPADDIDQEGYFVRSLRLVPGKYYFRAYVIDDYGNVAYSDVIEYVVK